jgi:hypothetical protein
MSGLVVLLLVGVGGLIWWINDRKATGGIDRRLLQATRGDKSLAKRLLEQARFKYPGKSERWYLEKVLYDLERDGAGSARGYRSSFNWNLGRGDLREKIFLVGAVVWLLNSLTSLIQRWLR